MVDKKSALSLLFDRPKEPIFKEKGDQGVIFDVPSNFITEKFVDVSSQIEDRFGDDSSPHVTIEAQADIDVKQFTDGLSRDASFSFWIPEHSKIAGKLIKLFMDQKTVSNLLSVAAYVRDRVNPQLFVYALTVVLIHREDTKGVKIPTFVEIFPNKFMDSRISQEARELVSVVPLESRQPINIPTNYTASNLDPEHKLWYFREDVGVNLHHWHWHLVYPFEGVRQLVAKDRRGELFYYMHQQIIARYKAERLCNEMDDIVRLSDFRKPIKEGYFPKMDTLVAGQAWNGRSDDALLKDVNRKTNDFQVKISDLESWFIRFNKAVQDGSIINPEGKKIPLDEVKGIDMLGNMMEASILSPNQDFYGTLHNSIHILIAHCHDPDERHQQKNGVLGDSTTAMRDPVFYRIHAQVDDMFQAHKVKLNPYTAQQLTFPEISIASLEVRHFQKPPNVLHTFWRKSDVNISRGLDFTKTGEVFVRFTHLQHIPYTFTMNVINNSGANRQGMVRIFLAPRNGFDRKAMNFNDQRIFMIELDKFFVNLQPGSNTIKGRSADSSVTIPHDQTFRKLPQTNFTVGSPEQTENDICGCGWPQHMLIPRGTTDGKKFDLFAMVSNFEEDQVVQDLVGQCTKATAYCGLRDRKYPDRRAMGFPFDRLGRAGTKDLASFLTPNMRAQEITIKFTDRVIPDTFKLPA